MTVRNGSRKHRHGHRRRWRSERGQVLALFAAGVVGLVGILALSIDVGRLVWARTQIQGAVDAAALAAAQDMPNGTSAAQAAANDYWLKNSGFIRSQGQNVTFTTTYPPGNRAIQVKADADIPTWFAKVLGFPKWHVSASGTAASQVLDIAVVLDISGSMCMGSYPETENSNSIYIMSPGRLSPTGGYAFPKVATAISATTGNSTVIKLNDIRIFNSTSSANNKGNFGSDWNSTTQYWNKDPDGTGTGAGARKGIIRIDQELFQITAVNAATNELTVTRAMVNGNTGGATVKAAHAVNAEVWALRGSDGSVGYCENGSYYQPTTSQNGPHEPFDTAISNAQYFTTLFNSAYDKIGLASYSSSGSIRRNLISDFALMRSDMDGILVPNGGTNIAYAVSMGRRITIGSGARTNGKKVMVLLTDGIANNVCQSTTHSDANYDGSCGTTVGTTTAIAESHVMSEVDRAKAAGITIYTIGLGPDVNDTFLTNVATATGGLYFKAPTAAELDDAFQLIAKQTHIELTQ